MFLTNLNPFMRYVAIQPSVMESELLRAAYDYRLVYILDGTGTLNRQNAKDQLSPGTVLYVRPNMPYSFTGKMKAIVINFDMTRNQEHWTTPITPDIIKNFRPELIFENTPPAELEEYIILHDQYQLETLFRDLVSCRRFKSAYSDARSSAIIKELLCLILQSNTEPEKKNMELVRQVLLYIQKHYDTDLQNTDIAAEFGYHPFYLNRIFKECTGQTLHQTVLSERIRIAKQLLANTKLPIESVAAESGFSDRSQFGTTFKKVTGMSPASYRQQKYYNTEKDLEQ